jgi:hypothetical protein
MSLPPPAATGTTADRVIGISRCGNRGGKKQRTGQPHANAAPEQSVSIHRIDCNSVQLSRCANVIFGIGNWRAYWHALSSDSSSSEAPHDDARQLLLCFGLRIGRRKAITMTQAGRLAGLTAIVTGASQGIAEAIAKSFAREGAAVAIASTNLEQAQRVGEIEAAGGSALVLRTDVTRRSGRRDGQGRARSLGAVDILVNGVGGFKAWRRSPKSPKSSGTT